MWEYRAHGNCVLLAKQDCSSAVLVWENWEEKPGSRQAALACRPCFPCGDAPHAALQGSLAPGDTASKGRGRDVL